MDVSSKKAFAVREFCDQYGICRDTFYSEVKCGRLRALKVGKRTLVLKSDAEVWAASLPELRTVGGQQARA
jgi:excisionase family DNA binding protein